MLLLSLFATVWAAIYSAKRLVSPLHDLFLGTQAVADGDYRTQLPPSARDDELGFLVESFNDMTRKLSLADDDAHRSRQQVEEQRAYLEAVLSRLSSGVITLDLEGRLFTANAAAQQQAQLVAAQQSAQLAAAAAQHDAAPHRLPRAPERTRFRRRRSGL